MCLKCIISCSRLTNTCQTLTPHIVFNFLQESFNYRGIFKIFLKIRDIDQEYSVNIVVQKSFPSIYSKLAEYYSLLCYCLHSNSTSFFMLYKTLCPINYGCETRLYKLTLIQAHCCFYNNVFVVFVSFSGKKEFRRSTFCFQMLCFRTLLDSLKRVIVRLENDKGIFTRKMFELAKAMVIHVDLFPVIQ